MDVETAKYRITGLVDKFDEQMNIVGTFEIGSIQELPVEVGMKAVEEGRAEAVGTGDDTETTVQAPGSSGDTVIEGGNTNGAGATEDDNTEKEEGEDDEDNEDEV